MQILWTPALAGLLLLVAVPVEAAECSRVGFIPKLLGPAHGERGVPLNAHVSIDATGSDGGLVLERVGEDDAGTRVPVTFQVSNAGQLRRLHGRLIPANALAPETLYRVFWPGNGTSPRFIGQFWTGTQTDRAAQPYAGEVVSRVIPYDNSLGSPCGECWEYDNGRAHLLFPEAGEDALFNVYDQVGDLAVDLPRNVTAYFGCGPFGGRDFQAQEGFFITQGRHQFQVRAVDRAGNLSEPVSFDLWATCDNADGVKIPYCVDAGTASDLLPPPSEQPDGGGEVLGPRKGCGCGNSAGATAALALGMILVQRRRR
jgi:hypothetical protein